MKLHFLNNSGKLTKKTKKIRRKSEEEPEDEILDNMKAEIRRADKRKSLMPNLAEVPFGQITHGNVPNPGRPKHFQ